MSKKPKRKPANKYNGGYTHEALHTVAVMEDGFERHVVESRTAANFPDVNAKALEVQTGMQELYQLIGSKFNDD